MSDMRLLTMGSRGDVQPHGTYLFGDADQVYGLRQQAGDDAFLVVMRH